MEPRLWQLKNRIKYVENLRSGKFRVLHGEWSNMDNGRCVIGAYYKIGNSTLERGISKLCVPSEYLESEINVLFCFDSIARTVDVLIILMFN